MNNNLDELNSILFETLRGVSSGNVNEKQAQTVTNVANSIINIAKTQLQAYKLTKGKTPMNSFGKLGSPDKAIINEGDTYDKKTAFAKDQGYKNISVAISMMGKTGFESEFENWINQKQ